MKVTNHNDTESYIILTVTMVSAEYAYLALPVDVPNYPGDSVWNVGDADDDRARTAFETVLLVLQLKFSHHIQYLLHYSSCYTYLTIQSKGHKTFLECICCHIYLIL